MSKLNLKAPYGVVTNHPTICYVQDGKNFGADKNELDPAPPKVVEIDPDDKLGAQKTFLMNLLKENPLKKSVVYNEVESNNQSWPKIRDAASAMGIVRFTQDKQEMWRLPEELA